MNVFGSNGNWFVEQLEEKYNKQAQCLVNQYNDYTMFGVSVSIF